MSSHKGTAQISLNSHKQALTMMRIASLLTSLAIVSFDGCSAFAPSLENARLATTAVTATENGIQSDNAVSRRQLLSVASVGAALLATATPAMARLEAVNRPDLLPSEKGLNVIQTETFLTKGQAKRMNDLLTALERDTGFRVRVLCQAYPNTPGLAIRDYWDLGKVLYVVLKKRGWCWLVACCSHTASVVAI